MASESVISSSCLLPFVRIFPTHMANMRIWDTEKLYVSKKQVTKLSKPLFSVTILFEEAFIIYFETKRINFHLLAELWRCRPSPEKSSIAKPGLGQIATFGRRNSAPLSCSSPVDRISEKLIRRKYIFLIKKSTWKMIWASFGWIFAEFSSIILAKMRLLGKRSSNWKNE